MKYRRTVRWPADGMPYYSRCIEVHINYAWRVYVASRLDGRGPARASRYVRKLQRSDAAKHWQLTRAAIVGRT